MKFALKTWQVKPAPLTWTGNARMSLCLATYSNNNNNNEKHLPSDDPLLVLSLLFPSFFLLFPDDSELVDLLLALSFKEMFRLTGCDADPWLAPSCSNSRSNKKILKSIHFLKKSIAPLHVGEAKWLLATALLLIHPNSSLYNTQQCALTSLHATCSMKTTWDESGITMCFLRGGRTVKWLGHLTWNLEVVGLCPILTTTLELFLGRP